MVGGRSLRDLTQHLTTRADDSHAAPLLVSAERNHYPFQEANASSSSPGKVLRVDRIKPHAPLLVRVPVNSFEFQPCDCTPQAGYLTR